MVRGKKTMLFQNGLSLSLHSCFLFLFFLYFFRPYEAHRSCAMSLSFASSPTPLMCFQYLTHPQPCLHAHAHAQCRRRWFNAHRRTNVKRWLLLAATGAITAILGLLANLGSQKLAGVKFDYIGGILEKREWAKGFVLCVLCTAQLRGVLCAVCCVLCIAVPSLSTMCLSCSVCLRCVAQSRLFIC